MSYSCTDFTDDITNALGLEVPEKDWENPSAQADLAIAEIDRLQKAELALRDLKAELAYIKLQRDKLLEITWLDTPDEPHESTQRWAEEFSKGWIRREGNSLAAIRQIHDLTYPYADGAVGADVHSKLCARISDITRDFIKP